MREILICIIFLTSCVTGVAQESIDTIKVSFSKTTSVVFQYPIVHVDRGSRDLIAQKVAEVENILQLKAGRQNFAETNMTVITADGSLHHFYVDYSEQPANQIYRISGRIADARFKGVRTDIEYEIAADRILNRGQSRTVKKQKRSRITFSIRRIYTHEDMLFVLVRLRNKSNIRYDIESLRFFARDKKTLRRTASQEIEMQPLYVRNKHTTVNGHGSADVVFIFRKFTIPHAKTLDIELFERDGGRNLKIHVGDHAIVKAERLPLN